MRIPFKQEKCYYNGVKDISVYEQMLKAGFRFPLSALHYRLLQYLGLAVTQIFSNAWRVLLGAEVLYGALSDGARRMTMEEFFHCYCPSESHSQEACIVSCRGARCLGLCATPLIPTRTGRVTISLSKVTNGCVTLVTKNICPWTKHKALCPNSVCIRLQEAFYFFNFCDILTVSYCSPEPSRSHTWVVELLGEDFHKNQAIQKVVG